MVLLILTWKAELGIVAGFCVGSLEAAFCLLMSQKFVGEMLEELSGSEFDMCPSWTVDT